MNKVTRILFIWALVLSPIWIGLLMALSKPIRQGDLGLMLIQFIGVTAIGLIGLIFSVLTRKASNAEKLSVIGYLVPATLVCGYQLLTV